MPEGTPDRVAVNASVGVCNIDGSQDWRDLRPEKSSGNLLFVGAQSNLYHYTDIRTLYLVLESQTMWARHVRFSNDSKERDVGFELLNDHIVSQSKDRASSKASSGDRPDAYMICLCDDDNLLSMWRGYAHDQGIAIGLDLAGPASFVLKHNKSFPVKCQCNDKELPFGNLCAEYQKQSGIEPIQVVYVSNDHPSKLSHGPRRVCDIEVARNDRATVQADLLIKSFDKADLKDNPRASAAIKRRFAPYVKVGPFHEEREYRLLFEFEPSDLNQRTVVHYDEVRGDRVKRPHVEVMCTARISDPLKSYVLVDERVIEAIPNFAGRVARILPADGIPYEVIAFKVTQKEQATIPWNVYCYEKPTGIPSDSTLSQRIVDAIRSWSLAIPKPGKVKVWSENCWPIRSITVGPQANQDQVIEALSHYCKNIWYLRDVDVRCSSIPYRPPLRIASL